MADNQNLFRETINNVIAEEDLMLQQKLDRIQKSSETKFATAIINLREINDEYASACDRYNEYFDELQADHIELQDQLNMLSNEHDVAAAVSAHNGRSRIHLIDFSLNEAIQNIFRKMSPNEKPWDNLKLGWKLVGDQLYEKIAISQTIVRNEETEARARVTAQTDLSIDQQTTAHNNINQAIKDYDSAILKCKEHFVNAKASSEDEFGNLSEIDLNSATSVYKPIEMQDSRYAYLVNGIRVNDATSDALYELEKYSDSKFA